MLWETLEQVEAAVKARVAKAAEELVLKPTSESVWRSVGLQISAALGGPAKDLIWGHHDAGWLALYSYYRVVCGLTGLTKSLHGHTGSWRNPPGGRSRAATCVGSRRDTMYSLATPKEDSTT
jgi:hypothetical protein